MSTGTIDTLQIEIEASSNDAAAKIEELTKALRRLKNQADKGTGLEKVKSDLNGIGVNAAKTTKAFNAIKSGLKLISFRQIVNYLGDAVTSINDYVENLNLFQVSMRGFYDEAYEYAMLVNEKLGVDPSAWMRTQGVFMSMGRGFGMTEQQAYDLSESLTELSYDIGSLYNEDVERASLRLQSALAGEIEPIRRLGISISQATLQEYALSKGINESVASMTEQEKALLRSLKLIEGASDIGAIGDFARTLESPANALRVFSQQIEQLKRSIGSVLLPIIIQVLPYMQAFVSILTDAISRLATLLGLEMPHWDNSAWENAYSGAADAVDDTTAAVKKLKKETIGIDELNILGDKSGSGNVGGVSGWASSLEIPELWNKEAIAAIETRAKELEEKLKPILETAIKIAAVFLAWKIGNLVFSGISTLSDLLGGLLGKVTVLTPSAEKLVSALKFAGPIAAIAIMVARFVDLWNNSEKFRVGVQRAGEIMDGVFTAAEDVLEGVKTVLQDVANGFAELLPDSVKDAITSGVEEIGKAVEDLDLDWKDLVLTVVGFALLFVPGGKILGVALLAFEAISVAVRDLGSLSEEEWETMKSTWKQTWEDIKSFFGGIWEAIKENFKSGLQGMIDFIVGFFSRDWERAWGGLTQIAESNFEVIDATASGIFGADVWKRRGIETMNALLSGLRSKAESVRDFFRDLLPNTTYSSWTGKGFNAMAPYASGGFPDHGEMFIAREAGPELVGQIGRRTAVANNDQIVEGIANGVANANGNVVNAIYAMAQQIVSAVNEQSGDIYLDYDKVGRKMTQYASEYARARG